MRAPCDTTEHGYAFVDPTGKVHLLNESHDRWARNYLFDHPELGSPLEGMSGLLKNGWIRVANITNLSVEGKVSRKAWDAVIQMMVGCVRDGLDPDTIVFLDQDDSTTKMTLGAFARKFGTRASEEALYEAALSRTAGVTMSLRRELIRVAAAHPELRPHLVPLLKQASGDLTLEKILDLLKAIDAATGLEGQVETGGLGGDKKFGWSTSISTRRDPVKVQWFAATSQIKKALEGLDGLEVTPYTSGGWRYVEVSIPLPLTGPAAAKPSAPAPSRPAPKLQAPAPAAKQPRPKAPRMPRQTMGWDEAYAKLYKAILRNFGRPTQIRTLGVNGPVCFEFPASQGLHGKPVDPDLMDAVVELVKKGGSVPGAVGFYLPDDDTWEFNWWYPGGPPVGRLKPPE